MPTTLKETLRELQILLGKPHKKIAGTLKYYLDLLNIQDEEEKEEKPSEKPEKIHLLTYGKITWMDIKDPTRREISQLAEKFPFHPLHLEDAVSKGQSTKFEQNDEDKYLFLLLRFPHYNAQERKIDINQISFFLGENYLVTIHEGTVNSVSEIFNACQQNVQQRKAYINGSSAHLLYTIINQLSSDLSPLIQLILIELDEAEDIVFDEKVSGVYKIGQLRRKILSVRRSIGPLRALLGDFPKVVNKFSKHNLSVYFEDISDQLDKVWEILEESRETVDIYKDADFTLSQESTNRILAVLTILFTLSIPATVLGSLYGMNILLPGGIETEPWMFWGKYTTFIIILIVAALPALFMAWFFRRKGWF